jgi:hypothetical protein
MQSPALQHATAGSSTNNAPVPPSASDGSGIAVEAPHVPFVSLTAIGSVTPDDSVYVPTATHAPTPVQATAASCTVAPPPALDGAETGAAELQPPLDSVATNDLGPDPD